MYRAENRAAFITCDAVDKPEVMVCSPEAFLMLLEDDITWDFVNAFIFGISCSRLLSRKVIIGYCI